MFKKIAILAILITIFIGGNLLASETNDLHVYVWAQDVVVWKIYVGGEYEFTHTGDWDDVRNSWICQPYYITVYGEVVASGTFPGGDDYYITVPVEWPTNPDPNQ